MEKDFTDLISWAQLFNDTQDSLRNFSFLNTDYRKVDHTVQAFVDAFPDMHQRGISSPGVVSQELSSLDSVEISIEEQAPMVMNAPVLKPSAIELPSSSSPRPMEVDPACLPSPSHTVDISMDHEQHSAANTLASLHTTDQSTSPALEFSPDERERVVGLFQDASQTLQPFSPPRIVSVDPDSYLDDPLNFSQDFPPSDFLIVPRPSVVEVHAAEKDDVSTREGMCLFSFFTVLSRRW